MQRVTFFRLSAILILVGVTLLAIGNIVRSSYVHLGSAPALSGQVAQAAQGSSIDSPLPVPGKDFTVGDVHYFSDKKWAFVSFKPTNDDSFNAGMAILQKKDGIFQVVLGPSSALSSDYAYSLPPDLVGYLHQRELLE